MNCDLWSGSGKYLLWPDALPDVNLFYFLGLGTVTGLGCLDQWLVFPLKDELKQRKRKKQIKINDCLFWHPFIPSHIRNARVHMRHNIMRDLQA